MVLSLLRRLTECVCVWKGGADFQLCLQEQDESGLETVQTQSCPVAIIICTKKKRLCRLAMCRLKDLTSQMLSTIIHQN